MEIRDTEVWGFKKAIKGARNPLDSWDQSDSIFTKDEVVIGPKDMKLLQRLIKGGGEHRKFMRMIHVQADFDMPRYWWSEMDTYKFNTKNSRSTMHKLLNNNNPITVDLFVYCEEDLDVAKAVAERLEMLRIAYKDKDATKEEKKRYLVRAKRLLSEGFLQMRTVDTNYEELRNIYFQRKNHRLKEEWQDVFCRWVESLPYAKELILYTGEATE